MNETNDTFDIGTVSTSSISLSSHSATQLGGNDTNLCEYYKKMLTFDTVQIVRVVFMWCIFVLSTCSNCFILHCLWKMKRRSHIHVITLHLTLADLAFTFFSIPTDAVWNVTMSWLGGTALCKITQMLKQFGMYISSFMVVVIGLDRVCGIVFPMSTTSQQKKRTKIFLSGAWTISLLSSIPAAVLFSLSTRVFCNNKPPFIQCVDFKVLGKEILQPYYFYTMLMSFLLPFLTSVASYCLILSEITNMQQRDRAIMGLQNSYSSGMSKARKKTFILTSMVTASFFLLWGPYYAIGLYTWFQPENAKSMPRKVSLWIFSLMYVHPAIHPFIFGVFMKDVRNRFQVILKRICSCFLCCKLSVCNKESETQTIVKQTKKTTSSNNLCLLTNQNLRSSQEMPNDSLLQRKYGRNSHTKTTDTWVELNPMSKDELGLD